MIEVILEWLSVEASQATLAITFLGIILSVSIFADMVARYSKVPRITILVLVGIGIAFVQQVWLAKPSADLLDGLGEPLIQMALVMVAFLLGSELTLEKLSVTGLPIFVVSVSVVVIGLAVVGVGLLILGFPLVVAVSLASVSAATDPAAVTESVKETGDKRLIARVLLGVVAIDDAWGIIVFGLSMAVLGWILSGDGQPALLHAFWELGGAILLGGLIGLPAAWLTGRLKPGEPTLTEAIALILLLTGLSKMFGVSELLASMVAGALVANLAAHHVRSFREIEHIEWPFLVFFFVLSGASIDLYRAVDAVGLTVAYILLRTAGRLFGGVLAVSFMRVRQNKPAHNKDELPYNIGLALTPQAGVAIGMALMAAERFPEFAGSILPVVVASTVIFELVGPLLVKRVLRF